MLITLQSTTFSAHGGIPTYNRLVCRALNEFTGSSDKRALVATDAPIDIAHCGQTLPHLKVTGFSASRSAFVGEVLKIALTKRIDLALIGHVNYAPLGWMLKRLQPQLRYGVVLYGIDAWQKLGGLRRRALQQSDFMISISEYTKQKAVEINALDANKIHLLPNALEWTADAHRANESDFHAIRGTRLLSVCRLEQSEQYKGVDKVIEALPDVVQKVPDVQYVVVGGGTDLERHRQLARKLGVAERCHFLGFLSDDSLQACYRDCDVFVMPSAGEGFGFVFLEAMRYRKAIVAARCGGTPEVVLDGVTGLLVDYGDRELLAQSVVTLCRDPELRMRLGTAGYIRLQENFTFDHFKSRLNAILNQELPASAMYRSRRETAIGLARSGAEARP